MRPPYNPASASPSKPGLCCSSATVLAPLFARLRPPLGQPSAVDFAPLSSAFRSSFLPVGENGRIACLARRDFRVAGILLGLPFRVFEGDRLINENLPRLGIVPA